MHVPASAAAVAAATLLTYSGTAPPFLRQSTDRARIAGTLAAPDRRPLLSAAAILVPRDSTVAVPLEPDHVELLPDGRFTFRNVPPGRYQIRVRAEIDPRGPMLFGSYAVVVQGRNIDDLVVPLVEGAVIEGTLRWEDGIPPGRPGARVRAPLADGTSFGDSVTGDVAPNGSFRIRGVMPGAHEFEVEGLPESWAVKSVSMQGRDISGVPAEVSAGRRIADLVIVVSAALTELRGTVRDAQAAPAAGALVLAMPAAGGRPAPVGTGYPRARADKDGRFRIRGLAPGEYRVAAVMGLSDARTLDAEALARLAEQGTGLTAGAGGVATRDLTAVAAAGR